MWAIPKPVREAGRFAGAAALAEIVARGPAERRVGLKPDGRQPVRGGTPLTDEAGEPAGRVTSGGFGPSAGHPVAMGYVSSLLAKAGTASLRRRARQPHRRRCPFPPLHAPSLRQRIRPNGNDLFHRRPRMDPRRGRRGDGRHHRVRTGTAG